MFELIVFGWNTRPFNCLITKSYGGPNPNKRLTDEEILRRLAKYFEEHEYMQRREFESVCECSRYTATKKLKELVKAGKLRAMGAKNVRFYVKGSL